MVNLQNNAVIFGNGIWFGLLVWKLMGFDVTDSTTMKAFRRFQIGLPLVNGIVYQLSTDNSENWSIQITRRILQSLQYQSTCKNCR
jgi:hypothetical protein